MTFENTDPRGADSGGRQLPSLKLILLLLVAVGILIFFLQNPQDAEIEFLWMEVTWPVRTVILISVVAGIIIDRLGSLFWARARRRKHAVD
jgi:uncharacterized integral membrane protein